LIWFLAGLLGAGVLVARRHRERTRPRKTAPRTAVARPDQEPDQVGPNDLFGRIDDIDVEPPAPAAARQAVGEGWQPMYRRVLFRTVIGGYDRAQVDALVKEYKRRRHEQSSKRSENTSKLAEADRRVQAFEARVSELQGDSAVGSSLAGMANDLLDRTEQIAREFRTYAVAEAEAETGELAQPREIEGSARSQAEEIVAQAERERDELSRLVEESSGQIARFIEEGKVTAEEKARAVGEGARDRLREPVFELERIHEQQRKMLSEVTELHEQIETSWRRLIGG
jgi:hypothetical protein